MKAARLARHFLVDRFRASLGLKDQLLFSPLLVQMVVTRRCNLTCGYCNEFDSRSAPVPLEQLRSRITKAAALGTLSIELTGGEPLLHPDLFAVVEHATQLNFAARMMISNAYLLTEETINGLNETGLTHMQVSIDGVHPNRTTVKVLSLLRKKLELLAKNAQFAIQLSAVVGAAPQEEVVEVVTLAKDMGFRPRVLILHDSRGELKLNPEQLATYESIQPILGRRFRESHGYRERLIRGELAAFKCRAGARYIYVDEEGLARYCSQQRRLWSKPFLDMTPTDLRHNFHTPKACSGRCTIGCARTVSAYDEWRAQTIHKVLDQIAVTSPVAATVDDRRK